MRILLVEYNARLSQRHLKGKTLMIDAAENSREADRLVRSKKYSAIVLDLELGAPKDDGIRLLKKWRRNGIDTHVLALTSGNSMQDKLDAFSLGADDLLVKPFERDDLLARLRKLIHHPSRTEDATLKVFDLEIDVEGRLVKRAGRPIDLTPHEFALLHLLAMQRGKAVSRSAIREHLYQRSESGTSNVIDVYVRYLRLKIDAGFDPPLILTCWGKGYMLRSDSGDFGHG